MHHSVIGHVNQPHTYVPFGVTYEKIGTIQRRLAWPLHKDDTLSRSGRSTDLNIYFVSYISFFDFLRCKQIMSGFASRI